MCMKPGISAVNFFFFSRRRGGETKSYPLITMELENCNLLGSVTAIFFFFFFFENKYEMVNVWIKKKICQV